MTVTTASALQSEEIKPEIGSRICNSKDELLGGGLAAELRGLLERRGVLVFPEVGFTPGELVDFTATLGDYFPDTPSGAALTLSYDPETNPSAEYIKGSFYWHFDGYMNEVPILASILTAEVLAPWGGETEFANTYAAWEQLPAERQAQIEHLRAVHAMAQAQLAVEPEPSYETFLQWLKVPSRELPLVWTHRSGRKSLVIGNSAAGIVGMDPLESRELLVWLRDWATQERFSYSHTWQVGDAVMWDNTGTLHRARSYPLDSGRTMLRTKLAGEEPFA
jgi:alpha-ketoglutarate-dependent taurine dioxygenase